MKIKIADKKYLKNCADAINFYEGKYKEAIVSSIFKVDDIKEDMEFNIKHVFDIPNKDYSYLILQNNLGTFVVRADNTEVIEETKDIYRRYGIKRIIRSQDKTILITDENDKFITTKDAKDEDDIEKAVAFVILKSFGVNINDFYEIVKSVK